MSAGPYWHLDDDRKTVTITFSSVPPVVMRIDAGGVDELLRNLGEFRAQMTPEMPPTFALRQKVAAIVDPVWSTEPELAAGDSLLHLRDPRFGWLHYLIPRETARTLAGFLQNQVDAPRPGQETGRAD